MTEHEKEAGVPEPAGPVVVTELQLATLQLRSGGVLRLWWDGGASQVGSDWHAGLLIEGRPRVLVDCMVPIAEIVAFDPDSPLPPDVPNLSALTDDARWVYRMEAI